MSLSNFHPIIIIGAGPAGLTLALHLKEKGLQALILEKGEEAGQSWRSMPDFLSLVSLWKSNALLKKHRFTFSPLKQVHALDFAAYLKDFSIKNGLLIQSNTTVLNVEKNEGLFYLQTNKENLTASVVVNATGYYQSPFIPNYQGIEQSEIFKLHFKDYKSIDSLVGNKNILIIGSKLSAGQLLVDLKYADVNLSLSTRSEITSMSPAPLLKFFLLFVDYLEKPAQALASSNLSTSAPMPFEAKKMISKGKVKLYPAIKSIQNNSVTFTNGKTEPFDALLFATGFRPEFSHLASCIEISDDAIPKLSDGFESLFCENLFFLGLDHQRSFQSRFLRGIRDDAKELAKKIYKRLDI